MMSAGSVARTIPFFQLGATGLRVPMKLHQTNRQRLCIRLRNVWDTLSKRNAAPTSSLCGVFVLLQGGSDVTHGGSDADIVFRQESYFHWAFGGLEPDWYGAIDVSTERSVLFVPRVPDSVAVYIGKAQSPAEVAIAYAVDEVHYTDQMSEFFTNSKTPLLLTLHGLNTDSNKYTLEAKFDGIESFKINNEILHPEISECRVIKTAEELDVLRYSNRVSSAAHKHLMRVVKPGMHQFQAESLFLHYCYYHGAMRHVCYTCIGATGPSCAVLHYGHAGAPNEKPIEDGQMCLFDMGGEYYCYGSDITCSWPANGRFSVDQRFIYEAVFAAVQCVLKAIRPMASWQELHESAEKTLLEHLIDGGLLQGDVSKMMKCRLGATFMPHGLGHLMGCDVHDVGGFGRDNPKRSTMPGLRNLRTMRTLLPNMVLTVEPGCYFVPQLLTEAKSNPELMDFIVWDELERFKEFGGVRIEEDIVVTETGYEMLTNVPRTVDEIERWMAGESTD